MTGAGLAPLCRTDPADLLPVHWRMLVVDALRQRKSELLARPTPPMIRVNEIDECERIVVFGLLQLQHLRVDVDVSEPGEFFVSTPLPLGR